MKIQLEKRLQFLYRRVEGLNKRLLRVLNFRLASGLATIGAILVLSKDPSQIFVLTLCCSVAVFIFFIYTSKKIRRHLFHLNEYINFLKRQQSRTRGEVASNDPLFWGLEESLKVSKTQFCWDIQIVGEHSLFSSVSECALGLARWKLLNRFSKRYFCPHLDDQHRFLNQMVKLRWPLTKYGLLTKQNARKLDLASAEVVISKPFVEENFIPLLLTSLGTWVLFVMAILIHLLAESNKLFDSDKVLWLKNGNLIFSTLLLFACTNFWALKSVGKSFFRALSVSKTLTQTTALFAQIENLQKHHSFMMSKYKHIASNRPSDLLKVFERFLAFVGTEANPLIHLLINLLLPYTLVATYLLENKRASIEKYFGDWTNDLAEFEVDLSFALFFAFQKVVLPTQEHSPRLKAQGLIHPLIKRTAVVSNNVELSPQEQILLSGSNMSGKSTLMRAIGLNQLLFQAGAPVFCEQLSRR